VKERLTGAIILVALIVLLVPELLSGPSRSAPAPQAAATSAEEPPLRSYTIDLADDSHRGAGTSTPQVSGPAQPAPINESPSAPQPASSATDSGSTPAPEESHAAPTSPSGPTSQRDAATEEPQPAAPRKPAGAERPVAAKPATAQRPVVADQLPAGERYAAAEKPAIAPAAAGKSTSMGGWMVQLGVFASRENADRLTQELKGKGFHTSVSQSIGAGRKLWRVRAGPLPERAAAEQLNARLRAAGHAGSVVPRQ
jgi:DedD protein